MTEPIEPSEDDAIPRIAILGAGPIGLEAALYARFLGYEVEIFERGGAVCQNLRDWGHVRLFSPFHMNHTLLGVAAIQAQGTDWQPPAGEVLLTGRELCEQYFQPLADSDLLIDHLRLETEVLSVSRTGLLKGDLVGDEDRGESDFRILVRNSEGGETEHKASVVIDTTGTYGQPNWMGQGGGPAIGERAHRDSNQSDSASQAIEYGLPDILGADRDRYAGKRVLVIGGGYSAATSVVALEELASQETGTSTTWVTRTDSVDPIGRIENDQLPQRDQLAEKANQIAQSESSSVRHLPGLMVEQIESLESMSFRVELSSQDGSEPEVLEVDQIIANVGYRPDGSITKELQIHTCFATDGPMKLAAALSDGDVRDCLDQVACGPETLTCPEPNFYILGAKSYGRASNFLLATGFQQIREAFTLIGESEDLDLYRSIQTLKS